MPARHSKGGSCTLCPHNCTLKEGELGKCGVRRCEDGEIVALSYARPTIMVIKPNENLPLFHYKPGKEHLSVGFTGCSFDCAGCHTWKFARGEESTELVVLPEVLVATAKQKMVNAIGFSYNEPLMNFDYLYDVARVAKQSKIEIMISTNGFLNVEPLKQLAPHVAAANIDIKTINPATHRKWFHAELQPVLDAIKIMHKHMHIELSYLVIPGVTDSEEEVGQLAEWVKGELSDDVPLHIMKFFPNYKMQHIPHSSDELLHKLRNVACRHLKYVYIGNAEDCENHTTCNHCNIKVVERVGHKISRNLVYDGKCRCGKKLYGVWD